MQTVPTDEKLLGTPPTPEHNGVRDPYNAHGIRTVAEPPADGHDVHETLRTPAAAQRETERNQRLGRVRGKLPGPAGAPGRAHPEPATDAGILLPHVAAVPPRLVRHREDRLQEVDGAEAGPAGGELAEEIPADEGGRAAEGARGEVGGPRLAQLRDRAGVLHGRGIHK